MTACRYDRDHGARVLPGRHHPDCDTDTCRGCQPCTEAHCCVCGRGHCDNAHPQTCAECVGAVRDQLAAILDLTDRLPAETVDGGSEGRLLAGAPIPGGDAMVLLAPGSLGAQADDHSHESDADPIPPLQLLATWEDDWREILGHGGGPRATLWRCADYLGTHLTLMAQRHDAFDEFARDLAVLRARLENVLGEGDRPERAEATCLRCCGVLIRPVTDHGTSDYWHCTGCRHQLSAEDYNLALAEFTRAHLATAQALAARLGTVDAATIRQWASRGHVKRWGANRHGQTLYRIAEVERHARRHEQTQQAG